LIRGRTKNNGVVINDWRVENQVHGNWMNFDNRDIAVINRLCNAPPDLDSGTWRKTGDATQGWSGSLDLLGRVFAAA
jgi:hypothetical protein